MHRILFVTAILSFSTSPLIADLAFGVEYSELTRSLAVNSFAEDLEPYGSISGFFGFDWGNSMFYISHRNEDTRFSLRDLRYAKRETSFDWHWNEQTNRKSFLNTSLGVFRSTYEVAGLRTEEFWGLGVGFGATQNLIADRMFFVASAKIKLPYTDDERFLERDDTSRFFSGYEAKLGLGVRVGDEANFSLQAGYRIQKIDFDGAFIDDDIEGPYVGARIYFGE